MFHANKAKDDTYNWWSLESTGLSVSGPPICKGSKWVFIPEKAHQYLPMRHNKTKQEKNSIHLSSLFSLPLEGK